MVKYTNIGKVPDPNSCSNGEWWNDKEGKFLYVCFSGKNILTDEYVDITPIICTSTACANGIFEVAKETFVRKWSDPANWPNS